ncbi:MAG: DUF2141 domain-containing protein [Bacteroidota bacterium]
MQALRRLRFTLAVALAPLPAAAADLTLAVSGASGPGTVRAMVFADAEGFATQTHALAAIAVVPRDGRVRVTIADLPPGLYAVAAYQDVNGNQQLDRTWLGVPSEPYGFSRDARPGLSAVEFGDAVVELPASGVVVPVRLQ